MLSQFNETNHSGIFPYQRCLIASIPEDAQQTVRHVTNYIIVPLAMLVAFLSLLTNGLVLTAVIRTRSLQNPPLLLLCSLSITDLLWALFSIVRHTVRYTSEGLCPEKSEEGSWFASLCVTATVGNLTIISRDRYSAVSKPLLYRSNVKKSRVIKQASVVWLYSFLSSGFVYANAHSLISGVVPLLAQVRMLLLVHARTSRLFIALLISVIFTVAIIISFLQKSDLYNCASSPGTPQESLGPAPKVPFSTVAEGTLPHRTHLTSRMRCTQKLFLLILVVTAPDNIGRRNVIRKTWGSDPSMNIRWKTMFLIGQAKDSTQEEYLKAENLMCNDLIRGAQRDTYQNLTLKTQMGLEWAAKYCDFQFVMKTDDDVFVNPYRLMDYLGNPDTPKTKLFLGYVRRKVVPLRQGRNGVSVEEYNKNIYPDFCGGVGYVLSSDLVLKMVQIFDAKKPLKLEDVYIGTLVERLGHEVIKSGFNDPSNLSIGNCFDPL
ncbi:beta-1,3-galactosyltransferase 4-like [Orbicella faveolata]|uniref:beta-1,3-galactosyltransferase 4-like n=1 Tax=Orbicella faveolata TaxID=48498 RepID=UPI0009E458E3|nr:beta-1,3-galactosyltransferase 4-like [Orbicella faveolata]